MTVAELRKTLEQLDDTAEVFVGLDLRFESAKSVLLMDSGDIMICNEEQG